MQDQSPEMSVRPPVALGCMSMVAVAVGIMAVLFFGIMWLESGATPRAVLDDAESYGRGTYQFEGKHNLYIVRLLDGRFLALSDLDATNRANPGRNCRVAPIPLDDPALPGILSKYAGQFSPEAMGSTLVFRETCHGALYDMAGVRLDNTEALNLDRHDVDINGQGKLTVNTAVRICTKRNGADVAETVPCS